MARALSHQPGYPVAALSGLRRGCAGGEKVALPAGSRFMSAQTQPVWIIARRANKMQAHSEETVIVGNLRTDILAGFRGRSGDHSRNCFQGVSAINDIDRVCRSRPSWIYPSVALESGVI